jgi:hypothetical protein
LLSRWYTVSGAEAVIRTILSVIHERPSMYRIGEDDLAVIGELEARR